MTRTRSLVGGWVVGCIVWLALSVGDAPAQPGAFPDEDAHRGHAAPPDDPHADPVLPPEDPVPPPRPPSRAEPGADSIAPDHAGHGEDSHAGHAMPSDDPHADHAMTEDGAEGHAHHNMTIDAAGMVMNHNPDGLPRDCPTLAGEVDITVRAGREFAAARPGWLYGYDQHVWQVPPCTRVNVTLENRDAVRHQWMVHGLPRYLYPMGMFTLEVYGPGTRSASFVVPSAAKTYLAHCDVPHHMEKGMKGQLVVGGGDGDLPSIPGVSAPIVADTYPGAWEGGTALAVLVSLGLGAAVSVALRRA